MTELCKSENSEKEGKLSMIMKEKQCRVKYDLWDSTALLREKGGSGAAGTLWGERGLCCPQHIQDLPRKIASRVDC